VVCNFPIVAWKRVIFRPLLALAIARLRRRKIILIQHEWGSHHRLRRITYIPALLLANTIVMFSPLVRRELAEDWLVGWTAKKCVLAAVAAEHRAAPPGVETTPESRRPRGSGRPRGSSLRSCKQRLAAAATDGRLLIGHFGSIYPGKQPNALLRIGAILKQRGLKPLFGLYRIVHPWRRPGRGRVSRPRRRTRIDEDVIVSGYVASDQECSACSADRCVCYPLDEGSRRGAPACSLHTGRKRWS